MSSKSSRAAFISSIIAVLSVVAHSFEATIDPNTREYNATIKAPILGNTISPYTVVDAGLFYEYYGKTSDVFGAQVTWNFWDLMMGGGAGIGPYSNLEFSELGVKSSIKIFVGTVFIGMPILLEHKLGYKDGSMKNAIQFKFGIGSIYPLHAFSNKEKKIKRLLNYLFE